MNTSTPLACNMGIFTPVQREAHILNTTQLMQGIQRIQEIENGYAFLLPNESKVIAKITEFISNERLCCPFLTFTLKVDSNDQPVTLALTGPTGTQEFLREEFHGAFE